MFIWLKTILGLCNHKWTIIQHGPIGTSEINKCGDYFYLQCEKCGKIKMKKYIM